MLISARYYKLRRNTNLMKTNTKLSASKLDPPPSKLSDNVYAPLTIDSPDIMIEKKKKNQRTQKQWQQNNDFINKESKLFDELQRNRITIMEPLTKEDIEKFWKPLYEN